MDLSKRSATSFDQVQLDGELADRAFTRCNSFALDDYAGFSLLIVQFAVIELNDEEAETP